MDRWENQSRLVAGHDRLGDRRPDLRRRHRAQERRRGERDDLRGDGRRVAEERRELDGHHQRPVLRQALLPAPDQGRQPQRRQHLLDRRQRAERDGRAQGRRPELPRARAPRRQDARRPDDPQHDRRRRPAARGRHPERPLLAPRQLRRLRRARSTARRGTRSTPDSKPDATHGRAWPIFAGERGEYELLAGGSRRTTSSRPWPAPPTRAA